MEKLSYMGASGISPGSLSALCRSQRSENEPCSLTTRRIKRGDIVMLATMRPKLNAGIFYTPSARGVVFRNRQNSFEIRGQTIYRWVARLAPYLNGEHTLDEITQGLDPQRQVWISRLLETLQAQHCLKDVSQDHAHTLTELEQKTYASAIAEIDAVQSSAAYRFEVFRGRRVLVIGSGLSQSALIDAILQRGVRHLSVLTT